MNNSKRFLTVLTVVFTLVITLCVAAFATEGNVVSGDANADGTLTWSLDRDTGVLTIGGTATTLAYTKSVNWNTLTNIPWSAYSNDVKEVIITAPVTYAGAYTLANLKQCVKITIPATLKNLAGVGTFSYDNRLSTITVAGNEEVAGVIDFRGLTNMNGYAFDGALQYTTPTILMPIGNTGVTLNFDKIAQNCTNLTFKVYPSSYAARTIQALIEKAKTSNNLCKHMTYEYYTAEDYEELGVFTGSFIAQYSNMTWNFDTDTGVVTLSGASSSYNQIDFSSSNKAWASFKTIWKDFIKEIVVDPNSNFAKCYGNETIFGDFINLEKIILSNGITKIQSSKTFAYCPKLTTFGNYRTITDGVINLSIFSDIDGDMTGWLSDDNSVTNVILPTAAKFTTINNYMFQNCTSLETITIPANFKTIGTGAFKGCTSLKKISIAATGFTVAGATTFPDQEGTIIVCTSDADVNTIEALGYTNTSAIFFTTGGLSMEGFAVREHGYNGLRGVFAFDNTVKANLEAKGFTLVEYGAILASEANYTTYGAGLTLTDGSYVTANAKVKKLPVYAGGDFVGNVLASSTTDTIRFAATVKDFTSNYNTNLYFAAYSIWTAQNGDTYFGLADSTNDDYDLTSIYKISLDMYKNGVINSASDTESIVWNTLLNGGSVTLAAGTDYEDGLVDMDGNAFGSEFVVVDVPMYNQSISNNTLTFSPSDVTFTLFQDTDGNYAIIFRGTGKIPNVSIYGAHTFMPYSPSFAKPDWSNKITARPEKQPNPNFVSSVFYKIKYAVVDEGITIIGNEVFSNNRMVSLVYPESLKSVYATQFQSSTLNTVFMAGTVSEVGLVDVSHIANFDMSYSFNGCYAITKIHLPTKVNGNSLGPQSFQNCSALNTVWCGDNTPIDNTIDLSNLTVTSVGAQTFGGCLNIGTVKLPEGITTINAAAFIDSSANKVPAGNTINSENTVKCNIWTSSENSVVTTFIADKSYLGYTFS